jgi:hypothetical protein
MDGQEVEVGVESSEDAVERDCQLLRRDSGRGVNLPVELAVFLEVCGRRREQVRPRTKQSDGLSS